MRVIICGGRDYNDVEVVRRAIREHGVTEIAQGGAPGADTCAIQAAMEQDIPFETHPADWRQYGRSAGPIRNQDMLEQFEPDAVIAFPGGKGTADMIRRARDAGVKVIEVTE